MERGGSYRVMPLLEDFPMRFTAVELFEIFKQDPYPFLLDSGIDHHSLGGLSFVGSNPFLVLKTKGRRVEITEGSSSWNLVGDPFSMIRELLDRYSIVGNHIVSPFLGGAVGYLSYDLCHFVEELPDRAVDDLNLPDCFLAFYDLVLIIDHRRGRLYICSTGLPETKSSLNR
ncbi:MAG TPA: aminodeoxychorismate synthase, component I, partial [Candidatus Latescibacteria bacterium]|nr:aminodeoxychorismate synthase, component I [Candidatus Latescibacterota bacterium]